MTDLQKERLLELLADQAVFGLTEEELMEVERLKKQFPDWEDDDVSLELAAAAVNLSQLKVSEDLPANLRTKIFAAADDYFEVLEQPETPVNFAAKNVENAVSASTGNVKEVEIQTRTSPWQWLGWAFAAAAIVALAITLLTKSENKTPEIVKNPTPTPQVELSNEQKREQLIASATDELVIPLANPKNEKEIVGEMVWSKAAQQGYLRFTNLPVNDAAKETYQLWIVDETQDAKTPLSGGIFNIAKAGETVVPVNAQLRVNKPKLIAVTVEKPGGVVVSKQEKVVALAKI